MAASLWEPAPPVGLFTGGGKSGREDFAYGWEGREWDASRPEALLRRVQKDPGKGSAKVGFGTEQNTIFREEARTSWETHQVTKGSGKEEVLSKSKVGAQSHGRTGSVGKGVRGGPTTVLRSAAGVQGYLKPILVNRSGQSKVLGSKVISSSPQRSKQSKKEKRSFANGYNPCHNWKTIWTRCSGPKYPRPAKSSKGWPANFIVKRYGQHHRHHHKNPPRHLGARTRSSKKKAQSITPGGSTRHLPPKKPPWATSQARPANPPHNSKEVKTGKALAKKRVKFEQQAAFSLSFDPTTVLKQPKLQNPDQTAHSTANPNARIPPQRALLTRRRNIRMPAKTSKTRKSASLPQPAIPLETNSRPSRISNLSTPSPRRNQAKKSYRDQIALSLLRNPHSFLAISPNLRNLARPKSSPSSTLKAKKSSESGSPLPRLPNSRPQQTLKKQQWQLPARTAQGWVNIKLNIQ